MPDNVTMLARPKNLATRLPVGGAVCSKVSHINCRSPRVRGYPTRELKLNIVRAISLSVPLVRAEGYTVHVGKQVATAEGRLVRHDGKLRAHASTTCLVFEVR